jgi:hypothetical protein
VKIHRLDHFVKGWLVGNFEPSLFRNETLEVGVKYFEAGQREASHKQLVATEITVVISGSVILGGETFQQGDIVVIQPGEFADFQSVTDSALVVLKFPSIPDDKVFHP